MAEAAHETPGEAEEQGPEQATSNDIDTGVQAVEVIGWVAKECASFFRRIAEKVKKYEVTGNLPEARASAQPIALNGPDGSEALEKPKPSKKSRKGGDKEKVKRTRAASYFNMFVKDQVELFNQQRKAQAEDDAKAGKEPSEKDKPTDTFKEAVAIWSSKSDGEKNEYKQKKAKQMIAAGLVPPATESNAKPRTKKEAEPGAAPAAAPSAPKASAPAPAIAAPAASAPAPAAAPTPAGLVSPTAAGATAFAADATPASDPERKKKKKKKRKSEQVEPATSLQTDGQPTEKKKKKKKKHHDHPEES